jgi:hypothetical protein
MDKMITFYFGNSSISVNYKSICRFYFDCNRSVQIGYRGGSIELTYPITCMVDSEKIIYAESSGLYNDVDGYLNLQSNLGEQFKFMCSGRLGETGEVFL